MRDMTVDCISVGELQELLAAGRPVTVLDVRSRSEVDWEIPGAKHVDAYADLQSGRLGPLAELDLPAGPVVTVCGVGRTAAIATDLLRANGVEALTLDGGMRSWSLAWNTAQTTISGCEVVQVRRTGKGCLSYIVESESEAVVIDASVDPDVYVRLLRERALRAPCSCYQPRTALSIPSDLWPTATGSPSAQRPWLPCVPLVTQRRAPPTCSTTPPRSRATHCFSTASAGLTSTAAPTRN